MSNVPGGVTSHDCLDSPSRHGPHGFAGRALMGSSRRLPQSRSTWRSLKWWVLPRRIPFVCRSVFGTVRTSSWESGYSLYSCP
jgi:hypothetical protein